jgi:hypothetical protein
MSSIDANSCLGTHDVLFVTIDTLRYDVAAKALELGETPHLAAILPGGAWEKRHSPSSFTFGAHMSFFAGFLPTPAMPRAADRSAHERLFAVRFPGSETASPRTLLFDTADIVSGFASHDYQTICIGGTGFFNKRSPLGSVLPNLFHESWWNTSLGVASRNSAANQIDLATQRIEAQSASKRLFVFLNVSACHAPHHFYVEDARRDTPDTQRAALADFDSHLPRLLDAAQARAPVLAIICSDHGSAFGDDGYRGHRLGHPAVWDVPYMQAILPQRSAAP